jgi:hypothetical protein
MRSRLMQVFARVTFFGRFLVREKRARNSRIRVNQPLERRAGLSSSLLVTETRAKLLTFYQSHILVPCLLMGVFPPHTISDIRQF